MTRDRNRFGPDIRPRAPERRDGRAVAFILGVLLACLAGAAFVVLRY